MHSMNDSSNDNDQLIEDTARRILAAHCTPEQLKDVEGAWNQKLWVDLEGTGLPNAFEPEGRGELDLPASVALNVVRVAGEYSTPVPLAENMLANWLLQFTGLPAMAGPLSVAPVNTEDALTLRRQDGGWRLSGKAVRVPWARYAAGLVVVACADGEEFAVQVPAGSYEISNGENLAREPRDNVTFDTIVKEEAVRPLQGGFQRMYAMGAAMRVLQIAGAMDSILRLCVQYVQDRKQFGKPLSKFQAIQQNIAVAGANVAAASAAANSVIRAIETDDIGFEIAAAKVRAGEASTIASKLAHQVHGAMGFTQEYELHFLTKRVWSWRDEFGGEKYWSVRIGEEVCRRGAENLWPFISANLN